MVTEHADADEPERDKEARTLGGGGASEGGIELRLSVVVVPPSTDVRETRFPASAASRLSEARRVCRSSGNMISCSALADQV